MTPSARIQAVLELLEEIEKTPRPADGLASAYFRARRYIGSHDRGAVSTMLYAILRAHARLGWWLEKNEAGNTPRARLIAWLALAEQKTADQAGQLFSGGKFGPPPLAEEEKTLAEKLATHTLEHPEMPENVRAECPDWAYASLKKRFGGNFAHEMEALLEPAPLDLRVNSLKAARADILAELEKAGVKAGPCKLSPFGIRIHNRPALNTLPMLKEGRVEIQDEGSQLVAAAVEAGAGMQVVDFCAGAGGKTLAIAAQMKNKGRILACDVLEKRLKRSTERFRRAGIHNIETRPLKNERDPWIKKHRAKFDRVLVDAPCTGVGAWRRNPDARWRAEVDASENAEETEAQMPVKEAGGRLQALGPGLEALVKLQAEILDSAARLVKPGGRLIYATCSLLPEENEEQVEKFLAAHADFTLKPPVLSLTPAENGTDGFFAAVMERAAISEPAKPAAQKTA